MSQLHVAALLALPAFALEVSPAVAQVIFGPGMQGGADRGIQGRATERDDAQCGATTTQYQQLDTVELVNVRLRGLTCTCADVLAEEKPPATEEPAAAE